MNKKDYTIRLENPEDFRVVENVTREAFWNQNVPGCHEHYYAHVLRSHSDFVPELDYVIEKDGQIIGNVMYSLSKLTDENGNVKRVLSFGPLSVLPEFQRNGYGKALLEHSFVKAKQLGYDVIVIFGNPDNYVARGFKSARKFNVCLEGDVFPSALLVKELTEGALDGRKWFYSGSPAEELCVPQAVESFDATFPKKKKAWKPSQEEFYIHCHSVING